jgi:hypothetical protein
VLQAHGGDLLPVDEDLAESDLRPRGDPWLAVGQLVHRRRMPAAVPPWASISTSQFQPYRAGWVTGPPRLASNTVAMTTAVTTKTDPARTPRGAGRVAGLDRTVRGRLAELLRTGRSERLRLRDRSTTDPQIFGDRLVHARGNRHAQLHARMQIPRAATRRSCPAKPCVSRRRANGSSQACGESTKTARELRVVVARNMVLMSITLRHYYYVTVVTAGNDGSKLL